MKTRIAASVLGLLLPFVCLAAADGELWEVTSRMNIPGMPAGMAGMAQAPQRVCTDPREDATKQPDMEKCKVVDLKESGTRVTMTMTCPDGRMVFDQTYNAARTEYKATMKMTGKDGDMVINSTGRKIGTCDVQQAKKAEEAKSAKLKSEMDAQIAAGQRQQADMQRQHADMQRQQLAALSKACDEAAAGMDARRFPGKEMLDSQPKEARGSCDARRTEFCKKLQGEAGFSQAARRDSANLQAAGELCAVQTDKLQATLCGGALKNESINFLSRHCTAEAKQAGTRLCPKALQTEAYHFLRQYCPADAKPIFAKNCAGRDYTMLQDRKQRDMCTTLARLDDRGEDRGDGGEDRGSGGEDRGTAAAPAAKKPTATEQVQQGVGKGLDKLRGLFGR